MQTHSLRRKKRKRGRTSLKAPLIIALIALFAFLTIPLNTQAQIICPFPTNVANEAGLNTAITCYNGIATAGTYTITLTANIDLTASTTRIENTTEDMELLIDGNGFAVNGQGELNVRPFFVDNSTVTFQNITIMGGNDSVFGGGGGGIRSLAGTVTIIDSAITGNSATRGGGIYEIASSFTIMNSTISGNAADDAGAGIYASGTLTMTNSTVADNMTLEGVGGGIYSLGAQIDIINSTMSNNSALFSTGGGAIYLNQGSNLTLNHATITDNTAPAGTGGGITALSSQITMTHSIIADQATGDDCDGIFYTSNGYNLDSDGTCNLTASTDIPNGGADLESLANNGGTTQTHAILISSDAQDAIPPADCDIATDQRGINRPQGTHCDIGAYELEVAQITISKSAEASNGEVFSFTAPPAPNGVGNGGFLLANGVSRQITLLPGTYNFTENVFAGWQLADIQCTGSGIVATNLATRTLTVTLAGGDSLACTYINERLLGSITVTKTVRDAPDDFDGTFTICLSGNAYLDCRVFGSGGGIFQWSDLPAGTYEVNENYPGDDWDIHGNRHEIVLGAGENATHTITNLYTPPPPPPACEGVTDLQSHLSGYIVIEGGVASGHVTNNSGIDGCLYPIGMAAYTMVDDNIDNQSIFTSAVAGGVFIAPEQTYSFSVGLPSCAAQVDLFYGDLISPTFNGNRYGARLLAAAIVNAGHYCP